MLSIQYISYNTGTMPFVIKDVDFFSGTINVIYGKNNCGKSSFCNAITSCKPINEIYLNKQRLMEADFSFMSSKYQCFFNMNGYDLIINSGGKRNEEKIIELTNIFNVPLHNQIESYSSSMKKIVYFIWLLTYDKKVYIFDDLFTGLDTESIEKVKNALNFLKGQSKIVVLTSNDLGFQDIADEVFSFKNGSLEPYFQQMTV